MFNASAQLLQLVAHNKCIKMCTQVCVVDLFKLIRWLIDYGEHKLGISDKCGMIVIPRVVTATKTLTIPCMHKKNTCYKWPMDPVSNLLNAYTIFSASVGILITGTINLLKFV